MDDERDDAEQGGGWRRLPGGRELAARFASQQGGGIRGVTWRRRCWRPWAWRPGGGPLPGAAWRRALYSLWSGPSGLYVAVGGTAAERALPCGGFYWSAGLPVGVTCAAEGWRSIAALAHPAATTRDGALLAVGYGELAARWGEIVARCGRKRRVRRRGPWDGRRRRDRGGILANGRCLAGAAGQGSGAALTRPGGGGPERAATDRVMAGVEERLRLARACPGAGGGGGGLWPPTRGC
jgi:hypothetical protein